MLQKEQLIRYEERAMRPDVEAKWRRLNERALATADPKDPARGYIVIDWMNKAETLDPEALRDSADVIFDVMAQTQPNKIIGIGGAGLPLARELHHVFTEIGLETGKFPGYDEVLKLDTMRNEPHFDPTLERSTVWVDSFTAEARKQLVMPDFVKGERVLLIDDVIAHGSTLKVVSNYIHQKGGVVAGIAANMSKDFQGGLKQSALVARAPAFAVIRFGQAVPELTLTSAQQAMTPFVPKIEGLRPGEIASTRYAIDR